MYWKLIACRRVYTMVFQPLFSLSFKEDHIKKTFLNTTKYPIIKFCFEFGRPIYLFVLYLQMIKITLLFKFQMSNLSRNWVNLSLKSQFWFSHDFLYVKFFWWWHDLFRIMKNINFQWYCKNSIIFLYFVILG